MYLLFPSILALATATVAEVLMLCGVNYFDVCKCIPEGTGYAVEGVSLLAAYFAR
jgi:hypothetical protein